DARARSAAVAAQRRPPGARAAPRAGARRESGPEMAGGTGGIVTSRIAECGVRLGLYLHIPFCSAICNYCNFNRGLFDADLKRRYVHALVAEIHSPINPLNPLNPVNPQSAICNPQWRVDSIYFGGGTPSLLEPSEIADVIAACRDSFDVTADVEITMEAN